MHAHNKVENILNRLQQILSVVDINIELAFNCIVNKYARFDIHVIIFVVPVRFVSNGDTLPSVWIDVSKSFAYYVDDAFRKNVRFLVKVDVVLTWVVKASNLNAKHGPIKC